MNRPMSPGDWVVLAVCVLIFVGMFVSLCYMLAHGWTAHPGGGSPYLP